MEATVTTTLETSSANNGSALATRRWSALALFAFRFVFAYLLLYNATQTFEYLPVVGEYVYVWLDQGWRWLVPIVGHWLFGIDITIFPAGSGDTTFNYVQILVFVALALIAAIVWTLLDRRRANYSKLYAGLRVYVRYILAMTMMSYGIAKVVPTQFGPAGPERLTETFGDSSPMGLLWTFMGYSTAYCVFIGLSETACGILLWYRRTTLSGAILTSIVMLNVFVLNMCFDVPVKLYSAHLVLMALWLLLPDVQRLVSVACLHRAVESVAITPLFARHGIQRSWVVLKTLLLGGYLTMQVVSGLEWYGTMRGDKASKLSGLYVIESFELDGELRPPLTTDSERWRMLIVGTMAYEGSYGVRIRTMDDQVKWLRGKIDDAASTVTIDQAPAKSDTTEPSEHPTDVWTFSSAEDGTWTITGTHDGKHVTATATRKPTSEFQLTSRGFHWINEFPFNR